MEPHGGSVYSLAVTNQYIICGTYENNINVSESNTECVCCHFVLLLGLEGGEPSTSWDTGRYVQHPSGYLPCLVNKVKLFSE